MFISSDHLSSLCVCVCVCVCVRVLFFMLCFLTPVYIGSLFVVSSSVSCFRRYDDASDAHWLQISKKIHPPSAY